MQRKLEDFQDKGIDSIAQKLSSNNSIIAVSPTGSGKTVIASNIVFRFISKSTKDVIVLVHREELMGQMRKAIWDWFGIHATRIDSNTTHIPQDSRVFVAMVETFNKRAGKEKFISNFKNVGLIIIDEAHLSNFKKIFVHFFDSKRIGFTATPIAATKKDPLLNYYQDIVVISTVSQLLELNSKIPNRGIVPCIEYSLRNINRADLTVRGEDFNEDLMSEAFRKERQVQNTLDAYITKGPGRKTLIFNVNIAHSKVVHEAFLAAGFNSRHLDGSKNGEYGNDAYRKATLKWFAETPDAILNNVGIATIGTDVPSVETVIVNKATMSLTLWKQMIGRGGRPFIYPDGSIKEDFLLLDMGDNISVHGRYSDDIDWETMFRNPKLPKGAGISAVKSCPECGAINYASARYCTAKTIDYLSDEVIDCGFQFVVSTPQEDLIAKQMTLISDTIDVKKNIDIFYNRKEYFAYYETIRQVAGMTRKTLTGDYLDSESLERIFNLGYRKAQEWYRLSGKRKMWNYKADIRSKLINDLKSLGFTIPIEEIIEDDPDYIPEEIIEEENE